VSEAAMNVQTLRELGRTVIDVFPFFNELELLELRLGILSPFVDKFVLVECPQTFSGNIKPLYFQENQARFSAWRDQIVHYVVDDPIESIDDLSRRLKSSQMPSLDRWILTKTISSHLAFGPFHWKQEFFQKESIRKAIPPLKGDDVVFFGDLDEVWNPRMEFDWDEQILFRLNQEVYSYWMNNRSSEVWTSAVFTAYKNLESRSLNDLRMNSAGMQIRVVPCGGWHFNYQGGADRIRLKLQSFGHQEFNNQKILGKLGKRLAKRKDVLGRSFKFEKSEVGLPPEVLAMKHVFPDWFL
jgi:beta-1,4-mannosyl-glycoprotein beta-1,4-N-acetylglucosaminyltransferase